ncbi:MAG: RnfH family protein [Dokdonella sp.]|uniref:RnfH family protein n=1 Tax=Dokdonella sp. TaxID=2291710 RepID=UPI003263AEAB
MDDPATATVSVEVAYAEPRFQFLRGVELPRGATVADAIAASGVALACSIDDTLLDAGIWSRRVARDTSVKDGDRIELYRPLTADPKESRRRRAANASRLKPPRQP